MARECVYCGTEYMNDEIKCDECRSMVKTKLNDRNYNRFIYYMGDKRYNNIDNVLESKRNKGINL